MMTKHKNDTEAKSRCTGLMLPLDDYPGIYEVSLKTIKQWRQRGYDLDDPPIVWRSVFSHQTWPKNFPTANGDNGRSWNNRWLELAAKRGVIREGEE